AALLLPQGPALEPGQQLDGALAIVSRHALSVTRIHDALPRLPGQPPPLLGRLLAAAQNAHPQGPRCDRQALAHLGIGEALVHPRPEPPAALAEPGEDPQRRANLSAVAGLLLRLRPRRLERHVVDRHARPPPAVAAAIDAAVEGHAPD